MRTFDIATKNIFLSERDLISIDIFNHDQEYLLRLAELPWMHAIKEKFDCDPTNNKSNGIYRSTCFEIAVYHLLDMVNSDNPACWVVACDIVRRYRWFYFLRKKYKGTIYPQVMVDAWESYCRNRKPQPFYLSDKSEMKFDILAVAYHYVMDGNNS